MSRDSHQTWRLQPAHQVVLAHEPGRLTFLTAEGPDHPHATEDLGGLAVDLLALLADVAKKRPDSPVPEQVGVINPGHQAECAQQQPPVNPGQDHKAADELNHGAPGVVKHAENQLAHAPRVLAQEAGGAPGLELVDPVQGKPHRVLINPAPDGHLHALGGTRRQPAAPEPEHGAQDRDRCHHGHQDRQTKPGRIGNRKWAPFFNGRGQRACHQHVIDHDLGRRGRNKLQQRRHRQAENRQCDRPPMSPQGPVKLAVKNRQRAVLACGHWAAWRTFVGIWRKFPVLLLLPSALVLWCLALDPLPVGLQVVLEALAAADPSVK